MVNVIKSPTTSSKGIVVFTHKERHLLDARIAEVDRALDELKDRYVIGMHWGWFDRDVDVIPHIQFHLAGRNTVSLRDGNPTPLIDLCSRNFLPDAFHPSDDTKYWDVIAIGRCAPFKRHEDYLLALRHIFDRRPETRALLYAAVPSSGSDYARTLTEKFNALFSSREQERIDLMFPLNLPMSKLFPVSHETMARFLQASRVFMHTSLTEGNVRVLHEALLCGLPCVVPEAMAGGGHDYLNALNSRRFGNPEEAGERIIELLNTPPDMVSEAHRLSEFLHGSRSLARLESEMKQLFGALGETFDGELNPGNYAQILSSHTQNHPRGWAAHPNQDDLASPTAILNFCESLGGQSATPGELSRVRRAWGASRFKYRLRKAIKRFSAPRMSEQAGH